MAKRKQRPKTEAEVREGLKTIVAEKGIELLKELVVPMLSEMVAVTKALDDGSFTAFFVTGDKRPTEHFITVGIELVLEHLPPGKERDKIADENEFWKDNKDRIMKTYGIAA